MEIDFDGPQRIRLAGRLDASQEEVFASFFDALERSATLDCSKLEYIASNGLGLLFATQRRLVDQGHSLRLVGLNSHIRELFKLAGFDTIFEID